MRPAAARAAAARLLDQVSLADAAGKRVDELSGGMAQRLTDRAIMHQPEVLFLDEPTTGLDPQSRLAVHDIITGLQAAGQTIMLITHNMAEADALADRVAIIDHGRLLALGTPAGLKRSVRGGTVVTVTAGGTGPAQLAAALAAGVPGARDARPLGDAVMLTVDDSQPVLPAVLAAADAARPAARGPCRPPDPGNRLHPAHRQGAPRVMTIPASADFLTRTIVQPVLFVFVLGSVLDAQKPIPTCMIRSGVG